MDEKEPWDVSNNIVTTLLLGLVFDDEFRAHADGVYQLKSGSWRRIEEFHVNTTRFMVQTIGLAEQMLVALARSRVPMIWDYILPR